MTSVIPTSSSLPNITDSDLLSIMMQSGKLSMIVVNRDAKIINIIGETKHPVEIGNEAAIGRSIDEYFSKFPDHAALYHNALANQPSKTVFQPRPGIFFEIQIGPLVNEKKEIYGAFGFATDITERATLHLAQKRQDGEVVVPLETRISDVFSNVQEGVFVVDREYTILKVNPAFERMCQEHLPLVGKKCYVTSECDQVCDDCPVRGLYETGKTEEVSVQYRPPTETRPGSWWEHFTYPVFSDDGEIVAAVCLLRDITERKRNEEALEQYRQKLEEMVQERTDELLKNTRMMQIILDRGNIPILFANSRGLITYSNTAFHRLAGFTEKDLLFKPVQKIFSTSVQDDEIFLRNWESLMAGRIHYLRHEISLRTIFGQNCLVDFTISSVDSVETGDTQFIMIPLDISEREVMMRVLERTHKLTQLMFDMTPLSCSLWNERGVTIDCNQHALDLVGFKEKADYLKFHDQIWPEIQPNGRQSLEESKEHVATALKKGYERFEWTYQHQSGEQIPCEVTLIRTEWGEGNMIVAYARDLREQKRMEVLSAQANERMRIMLDGMPLCCELWDADHRLIDCNQETVRLFHLRDKQEYIDRYYDMVPEFQPDGVRSVDRIQECNSKALRDGYCRLAWMHGRLDGTQIPTEVTLIRVERDGKNIVAAYARDLREEKRTLAKLQEADHRMRIMLQGMPLSCVLFDSHGHVIDCNTAAVKMFDMKNEQEFIDRFFDLSPPLQPNGYSSKARFAALHLKASESDHIRFEWLHQKLNGETIPVEVTLIRIQQQSAAGILAAYMRDLREQKLIEAERIQNAERLEKAKIEAETANKAKSEFLAHMSHEIRTPLNGVIGLCDLLAKTPLNDKQKEYTALIGVSGHTLLYLVNDILDFSKIEAGKLELDVEPFDLLALVESVLGILASKADEKRLELIVSVCNHLPRIVNGDSGRIRQILLNLLGNAVKFTNEGGVRIDLSVDAVRDRDVVIRFSVIDTGIGIPADRQNRLFRAFSQADTSSTRLYGGTGLGLAISMKLVKLMGGEMKVDSVMEKGSTFWFSIPLACEENVIRCLKQNNQNDFQDVLAHCSLAEGRYCSGFSNRRIDEGFNICDWKILVVTGNDVLRNTLEIQLHHWKVDCSVCASGQEAEALLSAAKKSGNRFELILVDSVLADQTGLTWLRKMAKAKSRFRAVPYVIYMQSLMSHETDDGFFKQHQICILPKPIVPSILYSNLVMAWRLLTKKKHEDAQSTNDTPSQVNFGLPLRLLNTDQATHPPSDIVLPTTAGARILIVEDNRINQIVAENLLAGSGYVCDVVANGSEACDAVRKTHYNLVLMDCQMPVMDGYDATDLIRHWEQEQGLKHMPIIALTANATKEDIQRCLRAGMDDFCSKPINPQTIVRLIEEWMAKYPR